MLTIPRESIEYLPVSATVDGDDVDVFQVAVVPVGSRPETWHAHPYLLSALTPGSYNVFVKVDDVPEHPVIVAGRIKIT